MWNVVDKTGTVAATFSDKDEANAEADMLTADYMDDLEAGFVDHVPSFRIVRA
jgi:hypothetical protein